MKNAKDKTKKIKSWNCSKVHIKNLYYDKRQLRKILKIDSFDTFNLYIINK